MKVRDLIAELSAHDPDSEVHIGYNYGDYWKTFVTPKITTVDGGYVIYSAYHDMYKLISDDEEDDKNDTRERFPAVILSH